MSHTPQLCLGTVQFGLPYGITNQAGQVPEKEVRRILDLAAKSGISMLDTAQSYGSAETVLGDCWPKGKRRRLISKLPAGAPPDSWEENLTTSLQRLKTPHLDGFLLHRSSDLVGPDGDALLDWLESLRDQGQVERIGVSIYKGSELDVLPLDRLQLVQLPVSVYDQRLIHDGTIYRLQDLGIAVHVRSVLLQGLLLQEPDHWPDHLTAGFRDHHARWLEHLQQEGVSPLAGALSFMHACKGIEAVLVGVVAVQELAQVIEAWIQAETITLKEPVKWGWENAMDLDPRCWPPR